MSVLSKSTERLGSMGGDERLSNGRKREFAAPLQPIVSQIYFCGMFDLGIDDNQANDTIRA